MSGGGEARAARDGQASVGCEGGLGLHVPVDPEVPRKAVEVPVEWVAVSRGAEDLVSR